MVVFSEKIKKARIRRKYRVRKKIFGSPERPRLSIFRSNRHIYVQIIDDYASATLASASTRAKNLRMKPDKGGDKAAAEAVGKAIAKEAMSVGIKCVCFDRNRYSYHGRVKALAEAAREAGLAF
ncbi:MAG: 50S ribosomal protein L18 [Planctomycetota bacterium]|jgi:large subunit ribosomal protein L18